MKIIYKYIRLTLFSALGGIFVYHTGLSILTLFEITPDRPGCETPIHWSFKNYDDRFPLSKKEFFLTIFEAEEVWEDVVGKNLFVYDSSAPFEIRTKFDKRQKRTFERNTLEKQLDAYKNDTSSIENKYYSLKKQYKINLQTFYLNKEIYENTLRNYNKSLESWNDSSRTSESKYNKLKKKYKDLEIKRKALKEEKIKISTLVKNINNLAKQINIKADFINKKIETFKGKYGEPTPFVQGLYTSNLDNITIFEFKNKDDLKLALAHELGHALGIKEHVENPASLMYYLMSEQNIDNPKLSQEDIDAYNNLACPPRTFSKSEQLKRYLIFTNWKDMKISEILNILQISK